MAFYTYKNCKIQMNDNNLFVTNAQMQYRSTNTPKYFASNRHSFEYSADSHIGGQLRMSYYLTGADPIKDYLTDESGVISGNFGGLHFKSGYLTSYQFSAKPASPVEIQTSVTFFDELKGEFAPVYEPAETQDFLNFSDAEITDIGGLGNIDNVLQVQYGFSSEVSPVIRAGEKIPNQVTFGQKSTSLSVDIDNLSGDLSISGNQANLSVVLKQVGKEVGVEGYSVQGILQQKSVAVSANEPLRSNLSVVQNFVSNPPIIDDFAPVIFYEGDEVTINGERFQEVTKICFGNFCTSDFNIVDDTKITLDVPYGASSRDPHIVCRGIGGDTVSEGEYTLLFRPISIDGLGVYNNKTACAGNQLAVIDPYCWSKTGRAGFDMVTIVGHNFDRVDRVSFGIGTGPGNEPDGHGASFSVISAGNRFDGGNYGDQGRIIMSIPPLADRGKIRITSTEKGQIQDSVEVFTPWPTITEFSPRQGEASDVVSIVGSSFSDTTGVLMGNLYAAFSVDSSSGISATVPDGLFHGPITVFGTDSRVQRDTSQVIHYDIFATTDPEVLTQNVEITGFEVNPWFSKTWDQICWEDQDANCVETMMWPQLKTACQNVLRDPNSRETINVTYSFVEDYCAMNAGSIPSWAGGPVPCCYGGYYNDAFSVLNVSNYVAHPLAPSVTQFRDEIADCFAEWKGVFEYCFPGLTLNFIDLGQENNMTCDLFDMVGPGSYPNWATCVALDVCGCWQPTYDGPNGWYYDLAVYGQGTSYNIGDIRISMIDIDGASNTIAFAYGSELHLGSMAAIGGDIFFDRAEMWRLDQSTPLAAGISIKQTLAHEIGHTFGIGHDNTIGALMYAWYPGDAGTFDVFWPNGISGDAQTVEAVKMMYGEGYSDNPVVTDRAIKGTPVVVKGKNFYEELLADCIRTDQQQILVRQFSQSQWGAGCQHSLRDPARPWEPDWTYWGSVSAATYQIVFDWVSTIDGTITVTVNWISTAGGYHGDTSISLRKNGANQHGYVGAIGPTPPDFNTCVLNGGDSRPAIFDHVTIDVQVGDTIDIMTQSVGNVYDFETEITSPDGLEHIQWGHDTAPGCGKIIKSCDVIQGYYNLPTYCASYSTQCTPTPGLTFVPGSNPDDTTDNGDPFVSHTVSRDGQLDFDIWFRWCGNASLGAATSNFTVRKNGGVESTWHLYNQWPFSDCTLVHMGMRSVHYVEKGDVVTVESFYSQYNMFETYVTECGYQKHALSGILPDEAREGKVFLKKPEDGAGLWPDGLNFVPLEKLGTIGGSSLSDNFSIASSTTGIWSSGQAWPQSQSYKT